MAVCRAEATRKNRKISHAALQKLEHGKLHGRELELLAHSLGADIAKVRHHAHNRIMARAPKPPPIPQEADIILDIQASIETTQKSHIYRAIRDMKQLKQDDAEASSERTSSLNSSKKGAKTDHSRSISASAGAPRSTHSARNRGNHRGRSARGQSATTRHRVGETRNFGSAQNYIGGQRSRDRRIIDSYSLSSSTPSARGTRKKTQKVRPQTSRVYRKNSNHNTNQPQPPTYSNTTNHFAHSNRSLGRVHYDEQSPSREKNLPLVGSEFEQDEEDEVTVYMIKNLSSDAGTNSQTHNIEYQSQYVSTRALSRGLDLNESRDITQSGLGSQNDLHQPFFVIKPKLA